MNTTLEPYTTLFICIQTVTIKIIHSENHIFENIVGINSLLFFPLVGTRVEALK